MKSKKEKTQHESTGPFQGYIPKPAALQANPSYPPAIGRVWLDWHLGFPMSLKGPWSHLNHREPQSSSPTPRLWLGRRLGLLGLCESFASAQGSHDETGKNPNWHSPKFVTSLHLRPGNLSQIAWYSYLIQSNDDAKNQEAGDPHLFL